MTQKAAPAETFTFGTGIVLTAAQQMLVQQYAHTLLPQDDALNEHKNALDGGLFIRIGTALVEPVRIVPQGRHTHVVLVIADRASVTIIEDYDAADTHAVEIFLGAEAHCEYISLQSFGSTGRPRIWQRSTLGSGAGMHWHTTTLGGADAQVDLLSRTTGQDATSSVDWIFYARDKEKQRIYARNVFDGARGSGEITMKGVAQEKGHSVCNGLIEIGPKGGGTDTYLTEKVLMLDASAKVDAVPGLEIKTNDVKASHSATVARVTEEDLFYFAARGIDARLARQMYVEGFLSDLTAKIGDDSAREKILGAIREKYAAYAHQY